MIPMISLQAHLYAGKRLKPGDKFDARGESDARLMRALGRAIDYTAPPEPVHVPARKYTPPSDTYLIATASAVEPLPGSIAEPSWKIDVTTLNDTEPTVADCEPPPVEVERPKRAYRRRDMKADA